MNETFRDVVVPVGPAVIDVSGAVMSMPTVNHRVAGVWSSLPASSRALTWKVYDPLDRFV